MALLSGFPPVSDQTGPASGASQKHVGAPSVRVPHTSTMAVAGSIGEYRQGARTPEGLQRISEANLKHKRQTKDKLEAQRHAAKVGRRVLGELKQLEGRLVNAGLMPDVKR